MKSADPSKCLLTKKNVFNLAVIDNIDFKERSFQFGNIYDVTRGTSHATLRMVFQFSLPEVIVKKSEPIRDLNIDTQIFGISQEMRDIIFKINEIFISLLAFRYNERQELEYNKIDLTAINSEILRRDFSLEENDFLDICADEAIFRLLIKCRNKSENIRPILGQWHTSKDMMSALVTLFSSYGIYDLATALGVKFLDKFAAVIDYRSTRRIKIEEILTCPANEKICLRIWYLYYEWFAIWKTHLTGIRCGNYELQKFGLAAFAPLFPATRKSNYATSVTHFLANLEKYPLLEKKLHLCTSINLAREGHYPAFDEALETHSVAYIKQNITGNSCNQENLELQIKATQEERNRIDTLLNEFLGTYTYQHKDHNTNNRIEPLWKLVHDLLEAFEMDNPINYDLFKKNSPPQLNQEGLIKINQAYMDGLKRIKEIFRQEVIKTEAINTKGRRVLSVMKTKISDLSKNKKPRKNTVPKNNGNQSSGVLPIQSNEQVLQSVKGNLKRASIELDNQNEPQPKRQRIRIITTEEEKQILSCLLQKETIPTETEINEVLSKLSQEWNIQRVKRYWNNNIRHKKKSK
ncbi:uncharacterized protein OCT59_021434 [Rhizophagus irregularis]|uniref:uncharacterized protein n=1 Tax=Rhizophagus irregularis TaxID=588596 RepID=UPI00332376C6|nr:hypothetical protein OCT59_021434 [Rhizophagus irregularis]